MVLRQTLSEIMSGILIQLVWERGGGPVVLLTPVKREDWGLAHGDGQDEWARDEVTSSH